MFKSKILFIWTYFLDLVRNSGFIQKSNPAPSTFDAIDFYKKEVKSKAKLF